MKLFLLLLLGGLLLMGPVSWAQVPAFGPLKTYAGVANSSPLDIQVADVNGDGKPDVLTANGNGTVSVQVGNGNGTFQAAVGYATGADTGFNGRFVTVADVNGDNKPDLLTANGYNGTTGVLLGNGNGTFQAASTYASGVSVSRIVVADINGDGKVDLLTSASSLLGTGNGTFQSPTYYPNIRDKYGLAVGDVNNDGKLDLVASAGGASVGVMPGNGDGTFQNPTFFALRAFRLALADINGDNLLDLLGTTNATAVNTGSAVSVSVGNGNGTFQAAVSCEVPLRTINSILVGNVNNDAKPDLLVGTGYLGTLVLLVGGINGFFSSEARSIGNKGADTVVAADINADGQPDLLMTDPSNNAINVLLNATEPPGGTTLPGTSTSLAPNPAGAATTLRITGLPVAVSQVRATVLDATGREVARHLLPVPARAGGVQAELATAGLVPGLYVVQLAATDGLGALVEALPAQRLSVQ